MLNNVPNKYKNLSENNKNVETKKGKTSLLEIRLNAQSTREGLEIREYHIYITTHLPTTVNKK
jgi:hypothetical protein